MARSKKEIMSDICDTYCSLSPENLTCDGEKPLAQVNKDYAALQSTLRKLFKELGREVSEMEAFDAIS